MEAVAPPPDPASSPGSWLQHVCYVVVVQQLSGFSSLYSGLLYSGSLRAVGSIWLCGGALVQACSLPACSRAPCALLGGMLRKEWPACDCCCLAH